MPGGYMGNMLRVDLAGKKALVEKLDDDLLEKFGGQVGLGARMLYDEVPPEVGGLDSANRLIFMTGVFTGTSVQSPCNFSIITKNPYGVCAFGAAHTHGWWGPRLRGAGFDGIIVQGKAEGPVYLWVHDGECEIRDAGHLWGKLDAFDTEDAIKKEVGQPLASVATIGPAGERLVANSMVQNDKGHVAARCNTGAVMGSKNLKAIAVHGKPSVPAADPEALRSVAKRWREENLSPGNIGSVINSFGTNTTVGHYRETGELPAINYQTTIFPADKLTGQYIRSTYGLKRKPCFGCSIAHCHVITVTEGPHKGFVGEEPDYEQTSHLGSVLGIGDAGTVAWLQDYIDRLGLDANAGGSLVSWAMEAYERGIVTKRDLDGLEMVWGNDKAAAELLRKISYRDGVGGVLALGLKEGPKRLGGEEAVSFSVHFKGEANKAHDLRMQWSGFLGMCVDTAGPRTGAAGLSELVPEGQAQAVRQFKLHKGFIDIIGICYFGMAPMGTILEAYTALTGWPLDISGAFLMAERSINIQRAYNVRNGFKPEMDLDVSPRLLEAQPDGPARGKSIAPYLEQMVREYNQVMEWDWDTGRPSREKLLQLGLEDLVGIM